MERTIGEITPRRGKAQEAYARAEDLVKILLAAMLKLAVCGGIGMGAAALLLDLCPNRYFWACSCAGILAYRWLSRLVSIKPKKKKRR